MSDAQKRLKKKSPHRGVFGDYSMFGFPYEDEAGEVAWHITAWKTDGAPVETYWVTNGEFLSVRINFGHVYTNNTLIETFGPVTAIIPATKETILKAIAKWEEHDRNAELGGE